MDIFGDDDDSGENSLLSVEDLFINELSVILLQWRATKKFLNGSLGNIYVDVLASESSRSHYSTILDSITSFGIVVDSKLDSIDSLIYYCQFDDLNANCNELRGIINRVVPGGKLLICISCNSVEVNQIWKSVNKWNLDGFDFETWKFRAVLCGDLQFVDVTSDSDVTTQQCFISIEKCSYCRINTIADASSFKKDQKFISREFENLKNICVAVSSCERISGNFTVTSHTKAVKALQEYGLCIFRSLFNKDTVTEGGTAACKDIKKIVEILKQRNLAVHLLHEGDESNDTLAGRQAYASINNFRELSMREKHRCDMRNTPKVSEFAEIFDDELVEVESTVGKTSPEHNLRRHPALIKVLEEVMFPDGQFNSCGNWGRWNFQSDGPLGILRKRRENDTSMKSNCPPLVIGKMGAVMGLPGCKDQTIHADTPHLFEHVQLPGHYMNLFIPAAASETIQSDMKLGQTAFVCKSHILKNSAVMMAAGLLDSADETYLLRNLIESANSGVFAPENSKVTVYDGEKFLLEELIRPHLSVGDCILWDARILHFGLGNSSKCEEDNDTDSTLGKGYIRPLLYVNYHFSWFRDPKNWNDYDSLFN